MSTEPLSLQNVWKNLPTPDIIMAAIKELSLAADEPGKPERTGIVLAMATYDLKNPSANAFLAFNVGDPLAEKLGGFMRNAPEKIARLYRRRREGHNEVTSAASADPKNSDVDKRTYGGAVVFAHADTEVYFSISGAHPLVDESVSYGLGKALELLDLKIENNHYIESNPYIERACQLLGCRPSS